MNITYLLGAGASYKALPLVNQINDSLRSFYNVTVENSVFYENSNKDNFFYIHGDEFIDERGGARKREIMKELSDSVDWLIKENEKHYSIDTFAKKLYLQREFKDLKKLKTVLCCLFIYLQNSKLDNRYDSFFASILDDLSSLPSNLKILSWNYDYQFEIAYSNFIKNKVLKSNQRALNVYSKGINVPNNDSESNFGIYKLNGTTSLLSRGTTVNILDEFEIPDHNKILNEIVSYFYYARHPDLIPTLSFAWEKDNDNYNTNVSNCIAKTDVLVIIGYSFPFFNRKIDKQILTNMDTLRYIYIQDPNNAAGIEERIRSILGENRANGINIKHITMTDQFYIPFEF